MKRLIGLPAIVGAVCVVTPSLVAAERSPQAGDWHDVRVATNGKSMNELVAFSLPGTPGN